MALKYWKFLSVIALLSLIGTDRAEAQYSYFNFSGTEQLRTNDCRLPNLPRSISSRLQAQILYPIVYIRDMQSGYLYPGGFSNRTTFYGSYSYPANGCTITAAHKFYNLNTRRKNADVYSSIFRQCPGQRMCTVTYYGKLSYR